MTTRGQGAAIIMAAIIMAAMLIGSSALPLSAQVYEPQAVPPPPPSAERGEEMAMTLCAQCHAIRSGELESPAVDAPPFWAFKQRWPLEFLEEALAEGIMVHNPVYPMPVFQFEPAEIADLVAYMETLEPPGGDAIGPEDLLLAPEEMPETDLEVDREADPAPEAN